MEREYLIPLPLYYILGCVLIVTVFLGIFMNGTSLLIFIRDKELHSPTNNLIASLLLGDFGISFGAIFSMVSSFEQFYVWGDSVCTFEGFWLYFMGLTNMYTLCVISIDRKLKITTPLMTPQLTQRRSLIAIFVVWFQGLCWACFPFLGWGVYTYEPARISCSVQWDADDIITSSYNMAILVWSFLIPIIVMTYSYYHVYHTVKHIARNPFWDTNSTVAKRNLRVEKRVLKTVVLMMCSFVGCWTPYALVSVWSIAGDARSIPIYILTVPAIIAKSSCIWDPVIYIMLNRKFRKSFVQMLPCVRRKHSKQKEKEMDEICHIEETVAVTRKSNGFIPDVNHTTEDGAGKDLQLLDQTQKIIIHVHNSNITAESKSLETTLL